jgi:murein DD-endopeptidase MepM/ murein hydrolase activator NlpD
LQKSTDGVGRRQNRPRPARRVSLVSRVGRRTAAIAQSLRTRARGRAHLPADSLGSMLASALRPFTTAERALPIAVAAIVAVASLLALLPSTPSGAAGAAQGTGTNVRLAVNGGVRLLDAPSDSPGAALLDAQKAAAESFQPVTLPTDVTNQPVAEQSSPAAGAVTSDGTLVTGYAPETSVEDATSLIQIYRVQKGDTLSSIASHFRISTMTLWWANQGGMKSKTDLHIGQQLRIPPANGVMVTVAATDTLESLAAEYHVDPQTIVDINQLTDPTLVVGQVLVIPGALGAPIPTPKPTPKPTVKPHVSSSSGTRAPAAPRTSSRSSGSTASGVGGRYSGGRMSWPVIGGGNYISQYYHYGHWAIDIAATYGSKVVAAASGRVIFAGWKSNGGGWQVWISHGGNIYTTYNHMSAITVGAGQSVSRGQQVGRIGMSGDATGPHLHFEVWSGGMVWAGGTRMNPLNYL